MRGSKMGYDTNIEEKGMNNSYLYDVPSFG
jgi:hypothetical protein